MTGLFVPQWGEIDIFAFIEVFLLKVFICDYVCVVAEKVVSSRLFD